MKNSISKKRLPQKPGSISINFANTVLVLGFLISLIIVFFSLYRYNYLIIPTKKSFYIVIIIFFVTLAFLFLFSLRLSYQLKVNLSVFLFTFTISVYFFEFFLAYLNLQRDRSAETIAKNTNIEFDYRTKMEVIDDIRKDGIEVYPNILYDLNI